MILTEEIAPLCPSSICVHHPAPFHTLKEIIYIKKSYTEKIPINQLPQNEKSNNTTKLKRTNIFKRWKESEKTVTFTFPNYHSNPSK